MGRWRGIDLEDSLSLIAAPGMRLHLASSRSDGDLQKARDVSSNSSAVPSATQSAQKETQLMQDVGHRHQAPPFTLPGLGPAEKAAAEQSAAGQHYKGIGPDENAPEDAIAARTEYVVVTTSTTATTTTTTFKAGDTSHLLPGWQKIDNVNCTAQGPLYHNFVEAEKACLAHSLFLDTGLCIAVQQNGCISDTFGLCYTQPYTLTAPENDTLKSVESTACIFYAPFASIWGTPPDP